MDALSCALERNDLLYVKTHPKVFFFDDGQVCECFNYITTIETAEMALSRYPEHGQLICELVLDHGACYDQRSLVQWAHDVAVKCGYDLRSMADGACEHAMVRGHDEMEQFIETLFELTSS